MDDDLRKRDPRNASGPFYAVEKLCLSCGLPEDEAPDLLANLDATGGDTFFVKQPETPDEVERACRAIDVCCVNALRYAGDDPAIIQRLQKWPPSADCCDALVEGSGVAKRLPDNPPMQQTGATGMFSGVRKWFGRGSGR